MSAGFFSFQGDYKRRNQINLGRVTHEDRAALLRKAQEERKAREEKRKQDLAAMKIQAFWRGRKEVANGRNELRNMWDFLVIEGDGSPDTWYKATRLFPFFYDKGLDGQRAVRLLRWLVHSKGEVNNWERRDNFQWVLKRLMSILLKSIGSVDDSSDEFDLLMVDFMGQHPDVLGHLIAPPHNLYSTLAALTIRMKSSVPQLVALATNPLHHTSYNVMDLKDIYSCFVNQFLSTGHILSSMGAEQATILAKSLSPVSLINAIAKASYELNPLSQLWLLGHFLLIIELSRCKNEYLRQENYVQALAQLLRNSTEVGGFVSMRWSSIGVSTEDEDEDEEDEEDDEEDDVLMKEDLPQRDISSFAPFDRNIRQLLDNLASRQQIIAIVASATSDTAAEIANWLIAVLQAFPTKRDAILMDLILIITSDQEGERRDIIGVLWARVKQGELFKMAKDRRIELSQLHSLAYDSDWPALVVLVYLYSRLLLTMIDDEFFNPSKSVINLDDVRVLSKFLCHIVFSMWWTDKKFDQNKSMGDTGVTFKQFRTIVTQCLTKLYLRDSRRQFVPKGHWLMMSETASAFISAVESEEDGRDEEEISALPTRRGIRAETRLYKRVVGKTNFATPRLNILRNVPFFIPFETRVEIFRGFIKRDRERNAITRHIFEDNEGPTPITREEILDDAFVNLGGLSQRQWKSPFHIQLVDKFGLPEAGIDGGGLTKEFLTAVCQEAFKSRKLFMETPERLVYPCTKPEAARRTFLYEFIGRIVGKCLYENVLVDVEFASFFLLKWFGRHAYLDDLPSLDEQIYSSLVFIKQYHDDFERLALTFSTQIDVDGQHHVIDLIPNGREIPVTYQNRLQYIQLEANYRLNVSMQKQSSAFVSGLSDLIDVKWLVMFNQKELQTLVGGDGGKSIDVNELKNNTVLGGYTDHDKTVVMFWEVMREMKEEDKRKLLKFVTSVERPPLLGFKELSPKFSLRKAGSDNSRLPTSSTCVNLLKLPDYKDKETLREKLLYAINAGAGFDLS